MILAGYHAVITRFKIAPESISKLFVVDRRSDFKAKNLFQIAKRNNVPVIRVSSLELAKLTKNKKNNVCAAFVKQLTKPTCLEELFAKSRRGSGLGEAAPRNRQTNMAIKDNIAALKNFQNADV